MSCKSKSNEAYNQTCKISSNLRWKNNTKGDEININALKGNVLIQYSSIFWEMKMILSWVMSGVHKGVLNMLAFEVWTNAYSSKQMINQTINTVLDLLIYITWCLFSNMNQ